MNALDEFAASQDVNEETHMIICSLVQTQLWDICNGLETTR